jgi:hypothetical protein
MGAPLLASPHGDPANSEGWRLRPSLGATFGGAGMQWFAREVGVEKHPRFLAFANACGLPVPEANLVLDRLLELTRVKYPDGLITGFTDLTLSQALGYGKTAEALVESGFLLRHLATNGYTVHDWMDRNGRFIEDAGRKKKYRKKLKDRGRPRTVRGCPAGIHVEQEQEQESFAGAGPPSGDHSLALTGPEAPSADSSAEILAPALRDIVSGLAAAKEMPRPKRKADWQSGAWEDAQAIGRDTKQASDLMAFAGWVHKQGPCDRVTLARIFRLIVTERILNPIAYFSRDGNAMQSLLGQSAVERAEVEQEQHREADKRMGIGR